MASATVRQIFIKKAQKHNIIPLSDLALYCLYFSDFQYPKKKGREGQ
jgi:hypothetical protein